MTYILKFTIKDHSTSILKSRGLIPNLWKEKRKIKWAQFGIFNVVSKSKISFQSIRQYVQFIWEVTSGRMEANKVFDSHMIKNALTAYILRYMVFKKEVIRDVSEVIKLENLMQQLNSDNHNQHPISFQITDAVRFMIRAKETNEETKGKRGVGN
jgi:hypothetical protein